MAVPCVPTLLAQPWVIAPQLALASRAPLPILAPTSPLALALWGPCPLVEQSPVALAPQWALAPRPEVRCPPTLELQVVLAFQQVVALPHSMAPPSEPALLPHAELFMQIWGHSTAAAEVRPTPEC